MTFLSAVYLNPVLDISPILGFTTIQKFILLNELKPLNISKNKKDYIETNKEEKEFINKLISIYNNINFNLIGGSDNYLKFKNKNATTVEYYFNLRLDKNIPDYLQAKIRECSLLIDLSFNSNKFILDLLPYNFSLAVVNNSEHNINFKNFTEEIIDRINLFFVLKYGKNNIDIIQVNDFYKMLRVIDDLNNI
jgi:hypothetical protein